MKEIIEKAFECQQNGQVDEAIALFQSVLEASPNQVDALHGLGLAYAQQQNYQRAVDYLKQAVQLRPDIAPFHTNLGNAYKILGQFNDALTHYREALKLSPNYAEAYNNIGSIHYALSQWDEAIAAFEKALRLDPQAIDAHFNLANSYVQSDRLLDALPHFEAVLKIRPDHISAAQNLGILYCQLKRFDEAKPLLQKAAAREPENAELLYHLALTQSVDTDPSEAIKTYYNIIEINPNHAKSYHNLATLLLRENERDKALHYYQKALKLHPNNATAKHMIDALTGKTSEAGAPLAYTAALFDQYAYNYNEHVKNVLHYKVPALLRDLLTPFVPAGSNAWVAADLGCGTGLAAPYFADVVSKIIGVDVSANMILLAKQLGVYQACVVEDILSFLSKETAKFDLLIAADVLTYFGALKDFFQLSHQALKPNGLLCFSIENLDDSKADYQLLPTGRYAHQPAYIASEATEHGFEIIAETTHPIRTQEDTPIMGNVYLLRSR